MNCQKNIIKSGWDKVSNSIKKRFDNESGHNGKNLKTKIL